MVGLVIPTPREAAGGTGQYKIVTETALSLGSTPFLEPLAGTRRWNLRSLPIAGADIDPLAEKKVGRLCMSPPLAMSKEPFMR